MALGTCDCCTHAGEGWAVRRHHVHTHRGGEHVPGTQAFEFASTTVCEASYLQNEHSDGSLLLWLFVSEVRPHGHHA